MPILGHEMKQGKIAFAVWTGSIAFLMVTCIFLFPTIKGEMGDVGNLFASMGSFTAAFGMDRLNFGTLIGFYAIECGNIVGLGGALFASLIGIAALSKEEKDHTAEFLLTHPVSRTRVITEKLIAVMLQIILMNAVILALSFGSMAVIGECIPWKEVLLLHLSYCLLHIELAGICFGISAFLCRGSMGIGLGLAMMMYFLNLVANMTDSVAFLKYITPFGYCEGADIITKGRLDVPLVVIGMIATFVFILAAYTKYRSKDIH